MNPSGGEPKPVPITGLRRRGGSDPAWGVPAKGVDRWPAIFAVLAAIALYVTLPDTLYYGPRWALPSIEGVMLIAILAVRRFDDEHTWQRRIMLALTAVINAANIGSLLLLIHALISTRTVNGQLITARDLVFWSAQVWLTNIIVFALWYWELDRGGPGARCLPRHRQPDLLFPQMVNPDAAPPGWVPSFFDYLYTSFTNASAFSPTDTMPLTLWAKCLFMIQAMASLLTIVLVAARAVNILH